MKICLKLHHRKNHQTVETPWFSRQLLEAPRPNIHPSSFHLRRISARGSWQMWVTQEHRFCMTAMVGTAEKNLMKPQHGGPRYHQSSCHHFRYSSLMRGQEIRNLVSYHELRPSQTSILSFLSSSSPLSPPWAHRAGLVNPSLLQRSLHHVCCGLQSESARA